MKLVNSWKRSRDFCIYLNIYNSQLTPTFTHFSTVLRDKRVHVVSELKKLQADTEPIMKIFENPEVISQIQSTRDGRHLFEYLETNHGVRA